MRNLVLKMGAAVASAAIGGIAVAAEVTTTFQVTATVIGTCLVSATDHAFGNYDPLLAQPADSTSTVTVQCAQATSYSVGLSAGGGTGATVASRKMMKGAITLDYSLFRDAGRAQVWGVTTGVDIVSGTGTGIAQNYTVYGRIPAAQNVEPGNYSDAVTVSVSF